MKIGQKDVESIAMSPGRAAGAPRLAAPSARTPAPADDSRGDVARILLPLVGRIDETAPSPARAAHLVLLRNAVAAGRYQPDLQEVARKLLLETAAERAR